MLHFPDEGGRGILHVAHYSADFTRHPRELLGTEENERRNADHGYFRHRKHVTRGFRQGSNPAPCNLWGPARARLILNKGLARRLKIIYTRGNRTETLASIATLKKILNRFVEHRVFYEISSRNKRGHEFFSTKNVFIVGCIEILSRDYLAITIFDAHNPAHSIEILNPAAMRIYDETPGKGFAVSFISESDSGVESRCYLRDEGDEGEGKQRRTALEKISLPQLFEYLEELATADTARPKV